MKRLNIVVPYRDRAQHLRQFVTALRAYFSRDKIDRFIPYQVLIIEQESGLPFNRGMLNNIGYILGRSECDYTCFHDVDYIPIWADYSWSDKPTAIVWYGAESRPVVMSIPHTRVWHDLQDFFGAVALVPNMLFEQANGFSNDYWGWGYEDRDLKRRFEVRNIDFGRRKGTFQPLDHDSAGFLPDGSLSPAALVTKALFERRWSHQAAREIEGLNTLNFKILSSRLITSSWRRRRCKRRRGNLLRFGHSASRCAGSPSVGRTFVRWRFGFDRGRARNSSFIYGWPLAACSTLCRAVRPVCGSHLRHDPCHRAGFHNQEAWQAVPRLLCSRQHGRP